MLKQWFVVHTKPRSEARVCRWLETKQVSFFAPKMEKKRKRRHGKSTILEPVFPGYVFVQLEPHPNSWCKLQWTPGVKRILGYNGIPSPVPEAVITLLKERTEKKGFIESRPRFVKGETVQITHGPLRGLIGVIEEARPGKERVRILMDLLCKPTKVQACVFELEKVPRAEYAVSS